MKQKVTGLGDIGLITDREAHDIPPNAWNRLSNVRCRRGRIEPVDGYAAFTTWTNTGTQQVYAHQLGALETESTFFWVYPYDEDGDGVAEKIYQYNGSTSTNITRQTAAVDVDYTGDAGDLWHVESFNGLLILTNGEDPPQYWAGSGKCDNLIYDGSDIWGAFDTDGVGGANAYKAKVIRGFRNHLFALNITEGSINYPQMVHWSSPADPGSIPPSWDYGSTIEDAGRTMLSDTDGHVLDALALGDQLIIYKEDAIYRASYVGGQFIFDFDMITKSHGLWAPRCAVDIGGRHVCLGDGVVYTHAGGQPENILEGRVADDLFAAIDPTNYRKAFLTQVKVDSEVWICYPEIGQTWANKALVWNYANNTWYERNIPYSSMIRTGDVVVGSNTAWSDGSAGDAWADNGPGAWIERAYSPIGDTLVAASDQLKQFGTVKTSDLAIAEKSDLILESPDTWAMIRKFMPEASGAPIAIRIGRQSSLGGLITWSNPRTFTPGTDYKIDMRENARIFALRIVGTAAADWSMSGYTFEAIGTGVR